MATHSRNLTLKEMKKERLHSKEQPDIWHWLVLFLRKTLFPSPFISNGYWTRELQEKSYPCGINPVPFFLCAPHGFTLEPRLWTKHCSHRRHCMPSDQTHWVLCMYQGLPALLLPSFRREINWLCLAWLSDNSQWLLCDGLYFLKRYLIPRRRK